MNDHIELLVFSGPGGAKKSCVRVGEHALSQAVGALSTNSISAQRRSVAEAVDFLDRCRERTSGPPGCREPLIFAAGIGGLNNKR